ncbi:MAG TPA: hypothetical protein VGS06_40390 [Streptosporangiaceae bacterium]|nr:hypothetical protein [Streptosporangiaceae bacterium]
MLVDVTSYLLLQVHCVIDPETGTRSALRLSRTRVQLALTGLRFGASEEYDHYDTPFGDLAGRADDIEAGRLELPPGWKLDRPSPGVLVWTTPSGRRYACGPTGEPLPLPDGEAPFHSWAS